MPIEMDLWRLGEKLTRIDYSPIDTESRLEKILADDISIAVPNSARQPTAQVPA